MAESMIIITGRLGEKPEVKDNGRGPWTRACLAHSQGHYDKQARQWVAADTDTAWFTLSASGRVGQQLAAMNKGDMLMVVGAFSVDEWEPQDGTHAPICKRTDLRIRVSSVAAVPSLKQTVQAPAAAGYAPAPAPATMASSQPGPALPTSEPWETYQEPQF